MHLLKAGAVRVRKRKLPISYEANLSLIKNKKFHVRRLQRKAENPKPNAFVFRDAQMQDQEIESNREERKERREEE